MTIHEQLVPWLNQRGPALREKSHFPPELAPGLRLEGSLVVSPGQMGGEHAR